MWKKSNQKAQIIIDSQTSFLPYSVALLANLQVNK